MLGGSVSYIILSKACVSSWLNLMVVMACELYSYNAHVISVDSLFSSITVLRNDRAIC